MNGLTALIAQNLILGQKNEQVVANNLANLETPGFKASRLSFQSALERAASQGPAAVLAVQGSLVTQGGRVSANGNNVSMTGQMVDLAKAQLSYATAVAEWNQHRTNVQIATEGKPM